ncbi:mitochondrial dicarboxylate carrier isoform X2 [Scaptodrosophila lebanonensis]|uniref:Mitochondrial dicarboxylate carrier isoform X2 n=1 Tax=Drosophila lebanonensis TaxID=7225 RepID=A0A6J2T4J2_DROLE|nr:mitochondrial dicarboxylate carrier isoform X2 [Scaptodrosophila lebanonensis]
MVDNQKRIARWYFGGVASSIGISVVGMTRKIIKEDGVLTLYNGISASLLRQYTYTLTRFGIYAFGQQVMDTSSMSRKVALSSVAGFIGGLVGAPGDMLNVRMQNDVKLPADKRRNYKHAIDGLVRVCREEGPRHLFNGAGVAALRGMLMTVGQIAFYEQTKDVLIENFGFKKNMNTFIFASVVSAVTATMITQPFDVVKTRRMSARPGEYSGLGDIFIKTAKEGPMAFFKGSIPAFTRLGPHTVILFLTLEFLRTHFGYMPAEK